jgi:uncharacterized membrane protein YphA (DoxX/SURF4 family)
MSSTQPKWKTVAFWVLSVVLGIAFIGSGVPKILGVQQFVDNFARWGFPRWFLTFTGVVEVVAGVLMLVPKTRFYGAAVAAGTMVGAALTHARAAEYSHMAPPIVLGTLAAVLAWTHRPTWLLRGSATATRPAA